MSIPVPYLRYLSGFGNEYATEAEYDKKVMRVRFQAN